MPCQGFGASRSRYFNREKQSIKRSLLFLPRIDIFFFNSVSPMTRSVLPFLLLCLASVLSGCLTVAGKEYQIRLNDDYTGSATIRFIDIASEPDDTVDASGDDFHHLISAYLNGSEIENQNQGWHHVRKRLYEENGVLSGEISFEFDSLAAVWLFRFDQESPLMFYVGTDRSTEEVLETNGVFNPESMPVVFWSHDSRELLLRTRIRSDNPNRQSLLNAYTAWRKNGADPGREQ